MYCALAIVISVLSGAAFVYLALQLGDARGELRSDLTAIKTNTETTLMKLSELAPVLNGLETTLNKVSAEVSALVEATRDVELPAEAQASIDRLTALSTQIDDLIVDTPAGTGVSQV